MAKPRTLKDMVLSHLDPDPEKAEHIYNNLTNDELIDEISKTVFTDFGDAHGMLYGNDEIDDLVGRN